jgi:methyl-accepting chemotaxis protein
LRDPDLGRTATLERLRAKQGLIIAGLADAIDSATAIGLKPHRMPISQELAADLPRVGIEGLLRGIMKRLSDVEASLNALDAAKRLPTNFPQQIGLLNFYVGSMRVEVDLAKLHFAVGEKSVDFNALARAAEAMANLTRDFVATAAAWAGKIADEVFRVAKQVQKQVQRVVGGVKSTIKRALEFHISRGYYSEYTER